MRHPPVAKYGRIDEALASRLRATLYLVVPALLMIAHCNGQHERSKSEAQTMAGRNPNEQPGSADVARMIDRLTNADIQWEGTLVGLTPTIVGDSARRLLAWGDIAIPRLVGALEDESKFVAAHVLLTLLSRVTYPTSPWNGLELDLSPDGGARFDVGQRVTLAKRWQAWQRMTPHPGSLPAE